MKRANLVIWLTALLIGSLLTVSFQEPVQLTGTVTAWCVVFGAWQISKFWFVARNSRVSKMSTDQATGYLILTIRRMVLTLVLALVVFLCARDFWGLVYWLSVAAYYQVGIALTIRDAWRSLNTLLASTNQV